MSIWRAARMEKTQPMATAISSCTTSTRWVLLSTLAPTMTRLQMIKAMDPMRSVESTTVASPGFTDNPVRRSSGSRKDQNQANGASRENQEVGRSSRDVGDLRTWTTIGIARTVTGAGGRDQYHRSRNRRIPQPWARPPCAAVRPREAVALARWPTNITVAALLDTGTRTKVAKARLLGRQLDLTRAPCLVKPGLFWAVKAQDREPALLRAGLNPVPLTLRRLLRPDGEQNAAIGIGP